MLGHPGGGLLSFTLQDTALLGFEKPWVFYRGWTEGGSSGSPVFDQRLSLIAMHRGKRPTDSVGSPDSNMGVAIRSMIEAIKGDFG